MCSGSQQIAGGLKMNKPSSSIVIRGALPGFYPHLPDLGSIVKFVSRIPIRDFSMLRCPRLRLVTVV
jgi:hypothetical protein